ncbi:hypothetical protein CWB72_14855 [Pseudoalteromonas phenolica]|uniref:HEAT repeat domain-containing protein n=1 Tax=Pseudoalteromonas phenolica TaxID=161398 RepID=UPI00110BBA51|nr:HEAT repeat domain-containing protein [Pseudoalteromonas phenolica]TMN87558.1 hypothetical protein CWB72_14855 [Pseudoalteromonas phenolica]
MISSFRKSLLATPVLALASAQAYAQCQTQFNFDIKTYTSFDYSKLNSAAQTTQVDLQGVLSVKPAVKGEDKNWWAVKADQVKIVQGITQVPAPSYQTAFAFKLNEHGLISDFHFTDRLDDQTQQKLKGLAYYLQYQTRLADIKPEQDTLGTYKADYKLTDSKISFTKTRYELDKDVALNSFNQVDILHSEHTVEPSSCFMTLREGSEELDLVGQDLTFHSKQRYLITQLKTPVATDLFNMHVDLEQWQTQAIELTEDEKARLAAELKAFLTQQDITQIDAYTLSLLLKKYDAVLGTLRDVFVTQLLSDNAQMRLFNALGQLDTEASQLLLSNLLVDTEKLPVTQFRALRALTQGETALTQQATDTLLLLLNDGFLSLDSEVQSSFYMTLGILLNNRADSPAAQQLAQAITEQITLGENEAKTADLITALGNSRDEQHVALIEEHLTDVSPRIEKASIRALGMMQSEEAYSNLEKHFSKHSGRNTKALVTALGNYQMQPKTSDSVLNIAVNDDDDNVRYAAINALAKQENQKGIKQTLRMALKTEKSKRNFKAIIKLLHKKD